MTEEQRKQVVEKAADMYTRTRLSTSDGDKSCEEAIEAALEAADHFALVNVCDAARALERTTACGVLSTEANAHTYDAYLILIAALAKVRP